MGISRSPARLLVLGLDAILRRVYGVWEFTQDPECILRVSVGRIPLAFTLSDGTVLHKGDLCCVLHLWNERVSRLMAPSNNLRGVISFMHGTQRSLQLVAAYAAGEPRLRNCVAVGGETSVFSVQQLGHPQDLLARFGFDYFPIPAQSARLRGPRGLLDRRYAWALMWAFNPGALRWKTFDQVGRGYFFMSREQLMRRYG